MAVANGLLSEGVDRIGPAQSPWPKMLGNACNTGLSGATPTRPAKPWLYEEIGADRYIWGAPALDADGTVYIGGDSLYALDGATGRKEWEIHVSNISPWPPIVGFDKTVYVSEYNYFCAIDGKTGNVRWRFKAADVPAGAFHGFQGSAALSADGTIYTTSLEGFLYALDSATGKEKWRFDTNGQCYGSPTIGADGTVYFPGHEGLYAVNGKSGKRKWCIPNCNMFGTPALGPDGTIYARTFTSLGDGKHQKVSVSALDSRTGETKWEFQMGKGDAAAPAVGADGTVYIGFEESWEAPAPGKVYAIDGKTGQQKWVFPTNDGVYLAPAIDSSGTVYVGTKGGIMFALEGATGAQKWQVDIGTEIGTPVAIGSNGLIYFGADDGIIYALRASDGARAPRPK